MIKGKGRIGKRKIGLLNSDQFFPHKDRSRQKFYFWAVGIDEMLFMKAVREDTVFEALGSGTHRKKGAA